MTASSSSNLPVFINLTGHCVRRRTPSGNIIEYKPSNLVIRLTYRDVRVMVGDVPVIRREYNECAIPPYEEGTYYIVSKSVVNLLKRRDLVYPDTHPQNGAEYVDGKLYCISHFRVADKIIPKQITKD